MEHQKNFLDHLGVIVRWRRTILTCVITVTLSTIVISLLLPKAYRARTVIFPPQESQDLFGLSSILGNLPMGILGSGQGSVSPSEFVPVIQSEKVAEAIAHRFNLMERYAPDNREKLLKMISEKLQVELSREQFLTVSYEDETPELAADLTNAFVEELNRTLQDRRIKLKSNFRGYMENRLVEAKNSMLGSEKLYSQFQEEHMVIDLEAQAKAQIESSGKMISELAELIVQREVATRFLEPKHPKLIQFDIEISGVRSALDQILMETSPSANDNPETNGKLPEIFIPFRKVPNLGLESLQLLREVKIQNAIYQFVLQEYEKARFEEENEPAIVIVLDKAVPPETRSSPRRTIMVILAFGLSLMLSTLLIFFFEGLQNLEGENQAKLNSILDDLKGEK